MVTFGKTIKLYLKDGSVTGLKFGEVVNNTIQSISCPRLRIVDLLNFPQSRKPGVYFLFGEDEETGQPKAYIGESENTYERLQAHFLNKEFWQEVVFFVSKDDNITKSHVKYLESRLIEISLASERYKIDNANQSQPALLPPSEKDAMEEFLVYIRLLLGVLGHKLLEGPPGERQKNNSKFVAAMAEPESEDSLQSTDLSLYISGLRARARQTEEGFVVLEGSEVAREYTASLQPGYQKLRADLIDNGAIQLVDDRYFFKRNTLFSAPSPADAIVVGYNINGPQSWKDVLGRTLKEIEQQRLKAASNGIARGQI